MDILDELNAGEPATSEAAPVETPVAEAPAEAPAQQEEPKAETEAEAQQRERDEKGRFKAKEAEPKAPEGYVPVQALQELRKELQSLKNPPQQQAQEPPQVPDMFENPEGYTRFLQDQIAQSTLNERLNLSEELVRQSAGDETVNAAQEWGRQQLATNPAFAQTFYGQRNPYGFLVNEFKRQQVVSKLGDADPARIDAFLQWEEAQKAPPPAPAAPAIPDTLATAQSARGAATGYQPPSLDEILRGK